MIKTLISFTIGAGTLLVSDKKTENDEYFYCRTATHCVLKETKKHETDKHISDNEWSKQLLPIARAIDLVARNNQERAALVTLGEFESKFARYVLENRCSDGPRKEKECDSGRAKGPWQQWSFPTRKVPDDINIQADMAIRLLRGFYTKCGYTWEGAFSGYATGGKCDWKNAKGREKRFYQILYKIERKERELQNS